MIDYAALGGARLVRLQEALEGVRLSRAIDERETAPRYNMFQMLVRGAKVWGTHVVHALNASDQMDTGTRPLARTPVRRGGFGL